MDELLQLRKSRQSFLHVPCATIRHSANRLDASSYCGKSAPTRQLIANGSLKADRLGDLATVTQPTVFGKRFMVGTFEEGIPLYPSGELLNYEPQTDSYIAQRNAKIIRDLIAQPGTLLLTRSGSVGRVVLTPSFMEGHAIQDDVLKVVPQTKLLAYYLYTYFSSPIGSSLLSDAAFGSVIQHIKVDHIRELPVFRIGGKEEEAVAKRVEDAVTARATAHELLTSARRACLVANHLAPLSEPVSGWLKGDARRVAFITSATALKLDYEAVKELRLEAHFFNPIARSAITTIKACAARTCTLGDLAEDVIIGGRSKRNYVESEFGTPFLSGKNTIQIRPTDLKHVSNSETEDLEGMLLDRGWILVTRSGTIGRTCFVWHNFEKYAASEHILRVIPNIQKVDPGYLYAFLSSEYGYEQIIRFRFGSVIDEISNHQLKQILVLLPSQEEQTTIGNQVRQAYEKRAEALRLEDEAQGIMMREIEKLQGLKEGHYHV